MTLSEAIEHAEWCADNSCGECAEEHRQLAEWLRELADEQRKVLILMTETNSLRTENAKLRELLDDIMPIIADNAFRCYGCKYDEFEECDYRYKCKLIECAGKLGIGVKHGLDD